MFNRDKKKKEKLFQIGKTGTADALRQAYKAAFDKEDSDSQITLRNGAIAAFHEGHPEGIQMMLSEPDAFKEYNFWGGQYITPTTLINLVTGHSDQSAIIKLALENISAEEKQKAVDNTLLFCMRPNIFEGFITALIENGANVNAFGGEILARAAANNRSEAVIGLLYKNGASFEDATHLMQTKKWDEKDISCLLAWQVKMTGAVAPATENAEILKKLDQALQEIADLREELTTRLPPAPTPETPAATANKPAKTKKIDVLSIHKPR